jgi:hypothetical protein
LEVKKFRSRRHFSYYQSFGFFAERIEVSATQSVATANALLALVNADCARIVGLGGAAGSALNVHHALQRQLIAEKRGGFLRPFFVP